MLDNRNKLTTYSSMETVPQTRRCCLLRVLRTLASQCQSTPGLMVRVCYKKSCYTEIAPSICLQEVRKGYLSAFPLLWKHSPWKGRLSPFPLPTSPPSPGNNEWLVWLPQSGCVLDCNFKVSDISEFHIPVQAIPWHAYVFSCLLQATRHLSSLSHRIKEYI